MPKIAIDYSKTQMYKLKHKNDDDDKNIYIGHTTNWIQRQYNHKKGCNNENNKEYNEKKYIYMRENGGWEEWRMIWIEDYPCNHKREAETREEFLRCNFNAILNMRKAIRTQETKKEYDKDYHQEHNQQIKENQKEYKKQHKQEIKKQRKEHYENNKGENILCECGLLIRKNYFQQHHNTQKHINLLKNNNICL
jgi:predicted GIY-YIG superfamily endonuclease